MCLPADIRLAVPNARFGFVFNSRGLVPEATSSWFLPRIVGISTALEWCYTAQLISAETALEGGLVRSLHEPETLIADARALAKGFISGSAPVSATLTRQMMWRGLGASHPMEAHRIDSRAVVAQGRGPDVAEGIMSFLEKRPPTWTQSVPSDLPTGTRGGRPASPDQRESRRARIHRRTYPSAAAVSIVGLRYGSFPDGRLGDSTSPSVAPGRHSLGWSWSASRQPHRSSPIVRCLPGRLQPSVR
jgi:hypothetical protein